MFLVMKVSYVISFCSHCVTDSKCCIPCVLQGFFDPGIICLKKHVFSFFFSTIWCDDIGLVEPRHQEVVWS